MCKTYTRCLTGHQDQMEVVLRFCVSEESRKFSKGGMGRSSSRRRRRCIWATFHEMRTVNSYLKLPRFPDRIQLFFRQPLESSFAIEGNSLAFVEIGFHEKIFEVERLFLHRRGRCTFVVVKVKYVGQRVPSCILWAENFQGVVLLVINSFFLGRYQCLKIIQNISSFKKGKSSVFSHTVNNFSLIFNDVKRDY